METDGGIDCVGLEWEETWPSMQLDALQYLGHHGAFICIGMETEQSHIVNVTYDDDMNMRMGSMEDRPCFVIASRFALIDRENLATQCCCRTDAHGNAAELFPRSSMLATAQSEG